MPENTNTNPLYLFFTQKEKVNTLFELAAQEVNFNKKIEDIIIDWNEFSIDKPFVYCQGDTIKTCVYDKKELNKSQYVLIHDYYNDVLEIDGPFVFFSHNQTNRGIIQKLKNNSKWANNVYESHHEKQFNNQDTPYWQFISGIVNHLKL